MIQFKYIFYYAYKLRIFFHTVRFAYHKMKDAKNGCFHEVQKERNFWRWVWHSLILTCTSMGMNRHINIKKIVFQKQAWKAMIINGENCSKWIFYHFLRAHFFVIKQNLENIVEIVWKSPKRVTYSLTNNIFHDHMKEFDE